MTVSDPDRWFWMLNSPDPMHTMCERIWGFGEQAQVAIEMLFCGLGLT